MAAAATANSRQAPKGPPCGAAYSARHTNHGEPLAPRHRLRRGPRLMTPKPSIEAQARRCDGQARSRPRSTSPTPSPCRPRPSTTRRARPQAPLAQGKQSGVEVCALKLSCIELRQLGGADALRAVEPWAQGEDAICRQATESARGHAEKTATPKFRPALPQWGQSKRKEAPSVTPPWRSLPHMACLRNISRRTARAEPLGHSMPRATMTEKATSSASPYNALRMTLPASFERPPPDEARPALQPARILHLRPDKDHGSRWHRPEDEHAAPHELEGQIQPQQQQHHEAREQHAPTCQRGTGNSMRG